MPPAPAPTMPDILIALAALHGILAAAFVAAFTIPLAAAGAETRAERARAMRGRLDRLELIGGLLDLALILGDAIPVFWIFSFARQAPDDVRAARLKWREEESIRWCFWTASVLLATLPLYFLPAFIG